MNVNTFSFLWKLEPNTELSMSMSRVRTAVRFFPEGAEPLWARAVTRGHAPLYEESWTLIL